MLSVRQVIIAYVTPVYWRIFPKKKVASLGRFSTVEKDSAGQLLQCLINISEPKIKAELFQHVLEEYSHADIFSKLASSFSENHFVENIIPRQSLVNDNASDLDIIKSYAYAHIGEIEVNKDFVVFANSNFDNKIRNVFARIAADEARHVTSTDNVLEYLIKDKDINKRWLLFKSLCKIRFEKFSSLMRFVGDFFLTSILFVLYFIFGLLIRKTLNRRLLLQADDHISIFNKQINQFNRINKADK